MLVIIDSSQKSGAERCLSTSAACEHGLVHNQTALHEDAVAGQLGVISFSACGVQNAASYTSLLLCAETSHGWYHPIYTQVLALGRHSTLDKDPSPYMLICSYTAKSLQSTSAVNPLRPDSPSNSPEVAPLNSREVPSEPNMA